MTRRSGLTLVEVLVAIFVMGIGMIALLTLFPIGVLQMAQAIRQDGCLRAAQTADTISMLPLGKDALGNATIIRFDATMFTNPSYANFGAASRFGMDASYFTSYSVQLPVGAALTMPDANPYGASYAVMVDPHGFLATQGLAAKQRAWVGGTAPNPNAKTTTGGLLRRPVSFAGAVGTTAAIKTFFSTPDSVIFDNDTFVTALAKGTPPPGTPRLTAATTMMRDTPFSWTYLLQRPRSGDSAVVDCTIVVFENRPLLLAQLKAANEAQLPEYVFNNATFSTTANTITIAAGANLNIRPGDWLYDATIIMPNPLKAQPFPEVMSAFYRVVAVDEIATNTYQFSVQQPIRTMVNDPTRALPGTIIIMDGIAEVFDRGPVRVP